MTDHIAAVRRFAAAVADGRASDLVLGMFRLYLAVAGGQQKGSWVYIPGNPGAVKGWRAAGRYVLGLHDTSAFLIGMANAHALAERETAPLFAEPSPGPLVPASHMSTADDLLAVSKHVADLAAQLAAIPAPPSLADADMPELLLADDDLMTRIVSRAGYDALVAMLGVLDGWIEGARENHEALGHRDADCCTTFAPDDIRRMVNDAAREVGTREPYRPPAP